MIIIKFTEKDGVISISPVRLNQFTKELEKDLSLSNAFARATGQHPRSSFDAKVITLLVSIESQSRIIVSKVDDCTAEGVLILKMDRLGSTGRYFAIGEISNKLNKLRTQIKKGQLWEAEF